MSEAKAATLSLVRKSIRWDLLALACLLLIAFGIAGFLLRDDLFLYGDHPGHYWVMWYTVNVSVPVHHRLIDWNPYWYAGYPELQFYPPGSVFAGLVLQLITLGRLSTVFIYEMVVFLSYCLPALTFYYALRHRGLGRTAAFAAGLLGLALPAFFDGATAVLIGMLGSRLAWAIGPLVLVWGIEWLEGRRTQYAWMTTLALAAMILAHPYHVFGILLALAIHSMVRRRRLGGMLLRLALVVGGALALDAFWIFPLFVHSSASMIPLLRSTLDQTWHLMTDTWLIPYVFLAFFAILRLRREKQKEQQVFLVTLAALFFVVPLAMLGVHVILIDRLQIYTLDPSRLVGEFYLPLVLLAGVGVDEIAARLAGWVRIGQSSRRSVRAIVLSVIALILVLPTAQEFQRLRPQPESEPRFLSQAQTDYRLDDLWRTLRDTPGRVWFASFQTRLAARGLEPFPTTLAALTPLFTNRSLVGGTYSHWSPIGATVSTGQPHPSVLRGLAEEMDDQALFGVPLEEMTSGRLRDLLRRLNITTIVATSEDYNARVFLDQVPFLQSYYSTGFFFVYRVQNQTSSWLEASNADVEIAEWRDNDILISVRDARPDASVSVKLFAYPMWHAATESGQVLPIEKDDWDMMRIALPPGHDYAVKLQYQDGIVEQSGSILSAASLLVLVGLIGLGSRKRR